MEEEWNEWSKAEGWKPQVWQAGDARKPQHNQYRKGKGGK